MSRALLTSVLMALSGAYILLSILLGPLWALVAMLGGYLLLNITWTYYLAVMKLADSLRADKLTPVGKANAYVLIALGGVPYVLFNWIVGTVLFLELPRIRKVRIGRWSVRVPEPQFTRRCQWHIRYGSGWRKELAEWCCHHLLDPFEEGGHC